MSNGAANLQVWVGDKVVCIRIAGRANFHGSVDFKALVTRLLEEGHTRFVLDLSECLLMDSTFLGVLAGLGLRFGSERSQSRPVTLELLNPSERVMDTLDNLGISHLFRIVSAPPELADTNRVDPASSNPGKNEVSRTCLEAHKLLMNINPNNVPKFKDVTRFLEEDLKRQDGEPGSSGSAQ